MSSSSSSPVSAVSATAPHVVDDCLGIVQLLSDGIVTRSADYSALPLQGEVPSNLSVQWKDVVYDAAHALRLRMYRPTDDGDRTTANKNKLEVANPAANPFDPDSVPLDDVAFPPLLVVDPDQDVPHDRIQDYAARLTAMGKHRDDRAAYLRDD